MSKAEVTITLDVARLRADEARLDAEIKKRQDELGVVRAKLQAIALLAPHAVSNGADADESEDDTQPTSVLWRNMIETDANLKPGEIRTRLQTLGFADKMKDNQNFAYGVIWRLTKRGLLVKKYGKYRAVRKESPQGDAGVLGTPVKH